MVREAMTALLNTPVPPQILHDDLEKAMKTNDIEQVKAAGLQTEIKNKAHDFYLENSGELHELARVTALAAGVEINVQHDEDIAQVIPVHVGQSADLAKSA